MIPINNSDTAWLIVADYNQDNNLPYEDLKNDIYCPAINDWMWEDYQSINIKSYFSVEGYSVGGGFSNVGFIETSDDNGTPGDSAIYENTGLYVGGNLHDPY